MEEERGEDRRRWSFGAVPLCWCWAFNLYGWEDGDVLMYGYVGLWVPFLLQEPRF